MKLTAYAMLVGPKLFVEARECQDSVSTERNEERTHALAEELGKKLRLIDDGAEVTPCDSVFSLRTQSRDCLSIQQSRLTM